MAKKQTSRRKKAEKVSLWRQLKDFLKDERTHFFMGLIFLVSFVVLTLAFVSFIFTGGADQSKLEIPWSELFLNKDIVVQNWTGKTGAWIANTMINGWFGLGSLFIVVYLFLLSIRFLGVAQPPLRKVFRHFFLGTLWVSITMGFFFLDNAQDSYLFLGGTHGYYMSLWLNALIGKIGTFFLIFLTAFAYLLFKVDGTLPFIRKSFQRIKGRLKRKRAEQEPHIEPKEEAKKPEVPEEQEEVPEEESILQEIPAPVEETPVNGEFDVPDESFTISEWDISQEKQDEPDKTEELTVGVLDEEKSGERPDEKGIEEEVDPSVSLTVESTQEEELVEKQIKLEEQEDYDPTLDLSRYELPPLNLLEEHGTTNRQINKEELFANKQKIEETLGYYNIKIQNIKATVGPTITLYEIIPAPGIRISKIKNLEDDIALSLAALGIRIIAPIPGKGTIGIEVPNRNPEVVSMKSVISSKKFQESRLELPMALGKTISNEIFMVDLAKMPHVLVAGATGQGKSVGINAIITSLIYKKHPSQLKFVMVDPKKVELSIYSKIEKHFLAKLPDAEDAIITDVSKVVQTLNSLTVEMDQRYELLKSAHARNIKEYNAKFIKRRLNPENGHRYLPYIVVVVDEFADLIMTAGKEVELPIARIAQLARAVGIHMIIATQRPSTNIITGVIKANFPARIAFRVASMIDSRTILDSPGANQLIGRGDMLISQGNDMVRVQCAFVDTPEVEEITDFIEGQQGYPTAFLLPEFVAEGAGEEPSEANLKNRDTLFEEAARVVVMNQQGSTSLLQRRFSIGYNRAGRLMDQLEAAGIVGAFEGSKARKVMVPDEYALDQVINDL